MRKEKRPGEGTGECKGEGMRERERGTEEKNGKRATRGEGRRKRTGVEEGMEEVKGE